MGVEQIIGVVGSEEKSSIAKGFGCDEVVITKEGVDLYQQIYDLTDGQGANAIYDGVGGDQVKNAITYLAPYGIYINFGDAAGKATNINLEQLSINSTYITKPILHLYKSNRYELVLAANELFSLLEKKTIRPKFNNYQLKQLPKVHHALENRKTTGSCVITL